MKFYYPLFSLLLLIGAPQSSNAQDRMDIGLRYELANEHAIALQYRLKFTEHFRWNIGAAFIPDKNANRWPYSYSRILQSNDTMVVERRFRRNTVGGTLSSGVTFQLPWKLFSLSADLFCSVKYSDRYNYNSYQVLDSASNYYFYSSFGLGFPDPDDARQTLWSIEPGLRTEFQMNLPINRRLEFTASIMPVIYGRIYVVNDVTADPMDEFWEGTGMFNVNFDMRASAGLRYRFGKKKGPKTQGEESKDISQ